MRNLLKMVIFGSFAVLVFSLFAVSQTNQPQQSQAQQGAPTVYKNLSKGARPAGPAPRRELTGAWTGPISSDLLDVPPMTPLGQSRFAANKPDHAFSVSESNDPQATCDPLGFPQNVLHQTRGIMFAQMPDRVLELFQFDRVWREIWTDGRSLPTNVGTKDGPDPRWNGYSVGHWDGDYTFVVDTVGSDERSWLDHVGHPHSVTMRVEERYKRVDHDALEMTVNIDDPKIYMKPFEIAKTNFKWIPTQEFEEQICVPSEALEYLKVVGVPAGAGDGSPAN